VKSEIVEIVKSIPRSVAEEDEVKWFGRCFEGED
jgi:hypothetical protein